MTNKNHTLNIKKILAYSFAFFCLVAALQYSSFCKQYQYKTEEWIAVAENPSGQMFYEKQFAIRNTQGEIIVWTKHVYSIEAHDTMASVLPNLAGFLYSLSLNRIDCRKGEYISLRMTFKTVEGKTLYDSISGKGQYKPIGYRTIPPQSLIGEVAHAVCLDLTI